MRKRLTRYLTTTHAGQRIGVSPFRAAQLFDSGDLQGIRDSAGRRLITEESVEKLAAQRRETARRRAVDTAGDR
jgi:hypothetical protein